MPDTEAANRVITDNSSTPGARQRAPASSLSLQEVHDLRAGLPDLSFDPGRDQPVAQALLAKKYLALYGIDFGENCFHRWGRVILPDSSADSHGWTIACHYWLPDNSLVLPKKGMVMVVHGYFDHVGLYGHLFRFLLDKGYGVIAFDLPGHGLSSGERASIDTFDHYVTVFETLLQTVRRSFSVPVSAIGQSTGGAVVLKYLDDAAKSGDCCLEKVALLAPLVEPAMWSVNRMVYALTHKYLKGVARKFIANSNDEEFVTFLAKHDPLQARRIPIAWLGAMKHWVADCRAMVPNNFPATILQGDKDTTLAWRYNLKLLAKKFPNSQQIIIEGARHHLANESPLLRQRIFSQMGF